MTRRTYTPEYKAKLVIEVLQGEKELNTIAAENGISPNMLRNWKAEFLENASRAFDGSRQAKEARRKEADLKKTQAQMLKTIGQLTLERDFLQDCFRAAGHPIPKLPTIGSLQSKQAILTNLVARTELPQQGQMYLRVLEVRGGVMMPVPLWEPVPVTRMPRPSFRLISMSVRSLAITKYRSSSDGSVIAQPYFSWW